MAKIASPQPVPADRPPTLLVVEDEVLIRLAIADYLRDCGYAVYEASSVAEAQAVLDAVSEVELVFSDVQLREPPTGFELATWIRRYYPATNVILTTGLAGAVEKARDLCHEGPVIAKPYDHEFVLLRIQELLRKSREVRLARGEYKGSSSFLKKRTKKLLLGILSAGSTDAQWSGR